MVFRLFIHRKLKSSGAKTAADKDKGPKQRRNRRTQERYPIDYKHLTLMSDQDILLIRELSPRGFSTYVSTRAFERFLVGDRYSARLRYLGEIYDLTIRVSWKSQKDVIGFEIMDAERRTTEFLTRLLYPITIATSLREVNAKFMADNSQGKIWYHGDEDTDLYIWQSQSGTLDGWQFVHKSQFIEWTAAKGVASGNFELSKESISAVIDLPMNELNRVVDSNLNPQTKQLAIDVFMAMNLPETPHLIRTLTDTP